MILTQREINSLPVLPVYMRTARRCETCGTLRPTSQPERHQH